LTSAIIKNIKKWQQKIGQQTTSLHSKDSQLDKKKERANNKNSRLPSLAPQTWTEFEPFFGPIKAIE